MLSFGVPQRPTPRERSEPSLKKENTQGVLKDVCGLRSNSIKRDHFFFSFYKNKILVSKKTLSIPHLESSRLEKNSILTQIQV